MLVYAGVPNGLVPKLNAQNWAAAALEPLGGRGGGKPYAAQGQGLKLEALPEAMAAAAEFARVRLL